MRDVSSFLFKFQHETMKKSTSSSHSLTLTSFYFSLVTSLLFFKIKIIFFLFFGLWPAMIPNSIRFMHSCLIRLEILFLFDSTFCSVLFWIRIFSSSPFFIFGSCVKTNQQTITQSQLQQHIS